MEPQTRSARDETRAEERSLAAEVKLYYDLHTASRTPAPLLIALHGYGASKRQMMREARALAPEGFGVASLQGFHQHIREPKEEGGPKKAAPHGRSVLPEHLERREVIHDLGEEQKLCPCCGEPRACIGEQTAERLEIQPAVFYVLRTVKKTYACRRCDPQQVPAERRIQTAGPEQVGPIAKGLCGPGLLASVITAKFADHTPLHRQTGRASRRSCRRIATLTRPRSLASTKQSRPRSRR